MLLERPESWQDITAGDWAALLEAQLSSWGEQPQPLIDMFERHRCVPRAQCLHSLSPVRFLLRP